MPGLVPGIHVFTHLAARKTWMGGHRRAGATPSFGRLCPAMTVSEASRSAPSLVPSRGCSKHEWHEHLGPAHIRRVLPGALLDHELLFAPGAIDEIDSGETQRDRPECALPDRRAEHGDQHAGIDRMANMRVGAGRDEIRILLAGHRRPPIPPEM